MSFKISIADVEGTVKTESQAAQGWAQAADDVMSALQGLCGLSCMQGAAADALRSRVYECLVPVAQSARLLATEYSARLLVYQDSWHTVEPDGSAVLPEQDMTELEDDLRSWRGTISSDADSVVSAASAVSDLVSLSVPSASGLLGAYDAAESSASDARNKCGTAEAKGADAFDEVEQFVSALDAYVSRVESSTASGFVPGKLASSPEAKALSAQFEASLTRVQQMRPQIEDAAQREQDYYQKRADEEAAKQREEQGWWQIAGGVVAGVVGVGAIVLTAGAATPIVVGAAVAGSAAFAYGASEVVEGSQNVYYGLVGDISSLAFNPLRDTVFGGEQASYDLFGQVATTTAGLFMAGGGMAASAASKGAGLGTQLAGLGRGAAVSMAEDAATGFAGDRMSDVASLFMSKGDAQKLGMGASFVLGMVVPGGSDATRATKLADGAEDVALGAGRYVGRLDDLAQDTPKLANKVDEKLDGVGEFARGAAKVGGSDVPRFEAPEKVPDDFRGVYADADGGLHVKVEPVGFNVNYNAKYDPAELDRQLKGQNEGLRRLTVKEYLENRAEYKANGRGKVASAKQREAREIARDKIIQELRDKGLSRNEAKTEANRIMAGQAALHEPDMVAGGKADGLQALTGNYSDGHYGLGDSGANSSLGAQWRSKRADALEQSIKDAVKGLSPEDLDSIYIDVDLRLSNWPQ